MLLEQELPECNRREQIDEISEKFCTNNGSSKNSRKRLSRTLFLVPRTRLDLLPYYSRMAAILDRVWPDISPSLVKDLEQQFHGQAKFKKNQNLEARLRTARYVGELVKFRVAPPMVFIRCIRRCLEDFTGANVDVACALLESCGRYLYRLSHTHATVTSLMESMTRLSKAKVSRLLFASQSVSLLVVEEILMFASVRERIWTRGCSRCSKQLSLASSHLRVDPRRRPNSIHLSRLTYATFLW